MAQRTRGALQALAGITLAGVMLCAVGSSAFQLTQSSVRCALAAPAGTSAGVVSACTRMPSRGARRPRSLATACAQTDDERREIDELRRSAQQAQQQPDRAAAAARQRVHALRSEYETKAAVREKIASKTRELLSKVSADPRLAAATRGSSVEDVLAKNPQVAELDADLGLLLGQIAELTRPGLCSLEAPSRKYGFVREMNAAPMVAALETGNQRAQDIAKHIIAADLELRFLSDRELADIEAKLAEGDNAEGAMLRRTAATIMRDFQKSIVEGAKEALASEMPMALSSASPQVAAAFHDELLHLLRLSQYAAAAAVASFTDERQADMLLGALERQGIDRQALLLSLGSMQKRANFLCKNALASPTSSPKCWVACHFALLHLSERLESKH
jgi:hypothetical protein